MCIRDSNGLPSERLVEKESGIQARDLPRSEFCEKCVETTQKYEAEFKALWKAMGFSCDWNLEYSTVSQNSHRLSQKSFIELAQAGRAYIKESPVPVSYTHLDVYKRQVYRPRQLRDAERLF